MNNNRTSSRSHHALHLRCEPRREQSLVEPRREHEVKEHQVVWVGAADVWRQVDELDARDRERGDLVVRPRGDTEDVGGGASWWRGMSWFWCQRMAMAPMRREGREGGEEGRWKREID